MNRLTLRGIIEAHALDRPSAAALLAGGRDPLTYAGLLEHVDGSVRSLRQFGVGRRDRVAVVLPNGPDMASAFLSVAAGAVCAPLNPAYRVDDFDFYLADLSPKALVVAAGGTSPARECALRRGIPILELEACASAGVFRLTGEAAASADGPVEPDDTALLLHTSGTTSRPKLVPLTQKNLCTSARNIVDSLRLTPADRCLNIMPLFHIHGLAGALLSSIAAGGTVMCGPGFKAGSFLEWLEQYRPTWYTAVPTLHQAILGEARQRSNGTRGTALRLIRSCSAPLPPQVMAELERVFGVPVIESYGMTEAAHQMASNPLPPGARKPGSAGIAAGPEVAIVDEHWSPLPARTRGEVVIRGCNVTPGYEGNPAANAGAFSDGCFRTGDEGYLDEEGYLFLTGRLKEIINRGGEKISPREIDEVLLDHPAVAEALAFAVPHATLGEDVAAAVVIREGAAVTVDELRGFAARRLADFKVPRKLLLVGAIPKGATGKPQRTGMAEKLGIANTEAGCPSVPPRTETERRLAEVFASVLNLKAIGIRDNFFDLGGDSLRAAMVLARVGKVLGRRLLETSLLEFPTVEALALKLANSVGPASTSPLIPLQPHGDRSPLFCIPDSKGSVWLFRELASHLAPDQPVYALQSPGLDGEQAPLTTVHEMAGHYLSAIKQAGFAGPYLLMGFCLGAWVALEMAVQLQDSGAPVAFLGVAGADGVARTPRRSIGGQIQYHWARFSALAAGQRWEYIAGRFRYRWRRLRASAAHMLWRAWPESPRPRFLGRQRIADLNHHAGSSYQAQRPFRGRVTCVEGDAEVAAGVAAYWSELATAGVDVVRVPGRGAAVLGLPLADALRGRFAVCLDTMAISKDKPLP